MICNFFDLLGLHELYLANGRVCGDLHDDYTFLSRGNRMGFSTVDYLLGDCDFIGGLESFTVLSSRARSDHRPYLAVWSGAANSAVELPPPDNMG